MFGYHVTLSDLPPFVQQAWGFLQTEEGQYALCSALCTLAVQNLIWPACRLTTGKSFGMLHSLYLRMFPAPVPAPEPSPIVAEILAQLGNDDIEWDVSKRTLSTYTMAIELMPNGEDVRKITSDARDAWIDLSVDERIEVGRKVRQTIDRIEDRERAKRRDLALAALKGRKARA